MTAPGPHGAPAPRYLLHDYDPEPWTRAYTAAGWDIGLLRPLTKVPVTPHGVLDFTSDPETIEAMLRLAPKGNLAGRVPDGVVVVDIDPRNGGLDGLARIEARCGSFRTLTCRSGRNDDGRHLYLQHPGGRITSRNLPRGVDLKTPGSYCVLPPSLHPVTGQPYWWEDPDVPIAVMHPALVVMLRPPAPRVPRSGKARRLAGADSVADWFSANFTIAELLLRANWRQLDHAGTRWLHPQATSALSATVKHDCLFVFSTSTGFEPTTPGGPHGYTPFRVFAVLEHGDDLHAAARAALVLRDQVRSSN